jgi:hypothetical protein
MLQTWRKSRFLVQSVSYADGDSDDEAAGGDCEQRVRALLTPNGYQLIDLKADTVL